MLFEIFFWFLVVVVILVLVHELGHFVFAKIFGVTVREFSVGFRPKIFSKTYKGTKYTLGAVPLGGFVDIVGIRDDERDEKNGFSQQNLIKKLLILFGGLIFNIFFAIFAFFIVFSIGHGFQTPVKEFADFGENRLYVAYVSDEINNTNISVGDRIENFDDKKSFSGFLNSTNENNIDISLSRKGENVVASVLSKEILDEKNFRVMETYYVHANLKDSLIYSSVFTYTITKKFFALLKNIFIEKKSEVAKESLSGPVKIAEHSAQAASNGFTSFVFFLGLLSISLALFNILPLPILDGGLICITLIESVFRFKIPNSIKSILTILSLIFILFLLVYVTKNDIGI